MYARVKLAARGEFELSRAAMNLFPAWPRAASAGMDAAALADVETALSHHLNKNQLGQISGVLQGLHRALEGKRGTIVDALRNFLARTLGNPALDESALLAQWGGLTADRLAPHSLVGRRP